MSDSAEISKNDTKIRKLSTYDKLFEPPSGLAHGVAALSTLTMAQGAPSLTSKRSNVHINFFKCVDALRIYRCNADIINHTNLYDSALLLVSL
jgi:hypothetical protein